MNLTLKQLRAFCTVYELRSFTKAAQALHLTQSAVSKLCAELEKEFGLPLFERSTRHVEPCDGADVLYAHAREILGSLLSAERSLSNLRNLESGSINVAASPMMMQGLIGDVLADFHARYPRVKLNLLETTTDQTIAAVLNGQADMGLVSSNINNEKLMVREVFRDRMFVACPADHPLAAKRRVQWPDVVHYAHIALHQGYSVRRAVDTLMSVYPIKQPSTIQTNMLTTALSMVRRGMGITVIPGYVCEFAQQLGIATRVISGANGYRHPISLVLRYPAMPSMAARVFQDELLAYLSRRKAAHSDGPTPRT
ncbi:LysR family transcriptional regulator [Pusillimonas sp. TS35]|uniref:LysR family transcriptional regulator n=1 Tax=Paracandidimonas lactea TaxID=2895524 RepID=UPI00136FB0A4|nr:LysR family transcriptional regulator [Paracandidimonas lactea]MYN14269.1 LysR family transcriptional regulator [Pusillimonas sp. TS35]